MALPWKVNKLVQRLLIFLAGRFNLSRKLKKSGLGRTNMLHSWLQQRQGLEIAKSRQCYLLRRQLDCIPSLLPLRKPDSAVGRPNFQNLDLGCLNVDCGGWSFESARHELQGAQHIAEPRTSALRMLAPPSTTTLSKAPPPCRRTKKLRLAERFQEGRRGRGGGANSH